MDVLEQADDAFLRGDLPAALRLYQSAIALGCTSPRIDFRLGKTLASLGRLPEARASLFKAIQATKDFAEGYDELGMTFVTENRWGEALACFQEAYRLNSASVTAINRLANLFQLQRNFDAALSLYRRAILIEPRDATPYNNYGCVLHEKGRFSEAIAAFQNAIGIAPDYADPYYNLGRVFDDQDQFAAALQAYRQANQCQPPSLVTKLSLCHRLQHRCEWEELAPLVWEIRQLQEQTNPSRRELASPFSFLCLPDATSPDEQLKVARRGASQFVSPENYYFLRFRIGPDDVHSEKGSDRPLRIGYLSADFHDHATGWLIAEVLEKHNRQLVSVYAYSYGGQRCGQMRTRISHAVDVFRDLFDRSDEQIAEQIARDQIDVLVDLKGYTRFSRTQILAFRPAPIQVNYLGYPGTMGADFIDYIVADDYIIPTANDAHYHESVIRLPGCYQANDSRLAVDGQPWTRSMAGLPETAFVCCSFNQYYKLTQSIFSIWLRLMYKHPTMVLWLFETDLDVANRLLGLAQRHGISPERFIFAPTLPHANHMARLNLADLFLDSYPVNAHTTASEFLRRGVPLVTMSGPAFVSRVAGSLLTHLGLADLVAQTTTEYESIASGLISDSDRLTKVRRRLQEALGTTDLFDGSALAHKLETAYLEVWTQRCRIARSMH